MDWILSFSKKLLRTTNFAVVDYVAALKYIPQTVMIVHSHAIIVYQVLKICFIKGINE